MYKMGFKIRIILLIIISCLMLGCARTTAIRSEIQQGKRYFEAGFYKKSMTQLLPLAIDGNAQAQYAVGYMYYYGYGVSQDSEVGIFWIDKAAAQGYPIAVKAAALLKDKKAL